MVTKARNGVVETDRHGRENAKVQRNQLVEMKTGCDCHVHGEAIGLVVNAWVVIELGMETVCVEWEGVWTAQSAVMFVGEGSTILQWNTVASLARLSACGVAP